MKLLQILGLWFALIACSAPNLHAQGNNGVGQAGVGQAGVGQGLYAEGSDPNPWFAPTAMQEQLRLKPEQYQRLQQNYARSFNLYKKEALGLPNDLTEEQLLARRQQMWLAFNKDFSGSLSDVMPEPTQRERFQQLMIQYQSLNAFDDPSLIQRLNLSAEQRQKINKLQYEWRRQMARLNRLANANRPRDFNWSDFYRSTNQALDQLLTPEQLSVWQELRGESYEFPETAYFPPSNK